jgi:hypothetical protein
MQTKYKASKVVVDDHKFDSKLEANIYKRIKELGLVVELQPLYLLQDKFKFGKKTIRAITYTADFKLNINGVDYILDAKGLETQVFKIKHKLFLKTYNQDIVIVKSVKGFNEWYEKVKKA